MLSGSIFLAFFYGEDRSRPFFPHAILMLIGPYFSPLFRHSWLHREFCLPITSVINKRKDLLQQTVLNLFYAVLRILINKSNRSWGQILVMGCRIPWHKKMHNVEKFHEPKFKDCNGAGKHALSIYSNFYWCYPFAWLGYINFLHEFHYTTFFFNVEEGVHFFGPHFSKK